MSDLILKNIFIDGRNYKPDKQYMTGEELINLAGKRDKDLFLLLSDSDNPEGKSIPVGPQETVDTQYGKMICLFTKWRL